MWWCEAWGIEYAISADLTPPVRTEITRLPEAAWQPESEDAEALRHWTEVPYVRDHRDYRKDRPGVRRYLALRVRKRQGSLFADGSTVQYFVVVPIATGTGWP